MLTVVVTRKNINNNGVVNTSVVETYLDCKYTSHSGNFYSVVEKNGHTHRWPASELYYIEEIRK